MNTNLSYSIQRIAKEYDELCLGEPETKYIIVYKAFKNCILKRELPDNLIIPSTRAISNALQLSRTTVIKAYELLQLEKLIVSKAGSGYRVFQRREEPTPEQEEYRQEDYPTISEKGQAFVRNISILNRQPETGIAFKPGLPPIDIFPINKWKKLLNNYWRYIKSSELSYDQASGSNLLKIQISNYLNISRNIKCDPSQVIIVSGSLQSIYLISNAIIDKGNAVVLEDPTFPNVHSIFKSMLARLLPITIDEEGIDITKLKATSRNKPKLIHVTPSDHYPFGVKMSLKRRLEVLEWASENRAYILENDYEHEIAKLSMDLPTLFSLDQEHRTIYLGTFNRLLYPSIRLGYMVVPKHLVKVIEALQEHSHRFVTPLVQLVMGQFIEKNYLFQHLKNLADIAQERAKIFTSQFEEGNQIMRLHKTPFNSLHMVALFNQNVSISKELELVEQLSQNEISAFSLSKCYVQETPKTGLILGYSTVRPALIKQKAAQMVNLISQII